MKKIIQSYKLRSEKYQFLKLLFTNSEIDILMEVIKQNAKLKLK